MTIQPLFQALPMLLVEKIIEYLEGRPRSSYDDDIDKHNEKKKILHPLLSVGEVWREAALESICDNCEIVFDNTRGVFQVKYPAWPKSFFYSQFPRGKLVKLVKRVVVTAPSWKDMCDKSSAETIAWSQYNGAIFPSATTLVVKLNKSKAVYYSKPGSAISPPMLKLNPVNWREGVVGFACALQRVTPAVTGVSVVAISADRIHNSHKELFSMLVSELCRGSVARLYFGSKISCLAHSHRLNGVTGLTSITQGDGIACPPIARLAYHNVSTLKELYIKPFRREDWSSLITCGGYMAPVSYTSLVSLSMDTTKISKPQSWKTVEGSVTFPILSKLAIIGVYPFDDDTLFRGNHGVLQNLSLPFDAIVKNALGRLDVLNHSGVVRMNSTHITLTTSGYWPEPSSNLVREQMRRILGSSAVLKLYCGTSTGNMFNTLCTAPSTAILQHLTLYNKQCTIGDVIRVVSALPSLVSLTTAIQGSAKRIGLIPENECPGILHEKYYPLSNSFRVLRIPSVANTDIGKLSIVAMQVAVICPSLAHVDLPLGSDKEFRDKVTWSSENGPFKPYGDALRRLI